MELPDPEEQQRLWYHPDVIRTVREEAQQLWLLDRLSAQELFEEFPLPEVPAEYDG